MAQRLSNFTLKLVCEESVREKLDEGENSTFKGRTKNCTLNGSPRTISLINAHSFAADVVGGSVFVDGEVETHSPSVEEINSEHVRRGSQFLKAGKS